MSTVAFKDGVIAADSRAYSGDKHPIGSKVKIRRLEDGTLLGATTTVVGGGERVMDWYERGCSEDFTIPDSYELAVIKPDGKIFYSCDNGHLSGPLTTDAITIGSGAQYALGAIEMGASASDAVRIACKLDVWSEGPIYAARHDQDVVQLVEILPRRIVTNTHTKGQE